MKAVILAGGKSTRTEPLTITKPKPMLKIANKTIIEHNLEQLKGLVNEAVIIIGFMGNKIKKHLGKKHNNIKIRYVKQKQQLGTANALSVSKRYAGERFIVMYGDDVYDKEDIKKCLKHKNKNIILIGKVKNPKDFGVCDIKNRKLKKIKEKQKRPRSNKVNTGLYVLNKDIFEEIKNIKKSKRGEYELTDAINLLAKKQKILCVTAKSWIPVPYSWSLLEANEFLLKKIKTKIQGKLEKNATIKGQAVIGKNTIVKGGAYIEGPVIIGKSCIIGPNCYIRLYTSVGNNCKIGNGVEVKNSIVMDNTKIPHLSYVGDSVIGENVNLGARTIIANLRHDKQTIKTPVKGKMIDSGRKKLGAIIADNVKTGIGTVIYPGRKIWPNKTTLPGEIVKKDIT